MYTLYRKTSVYTCILMSIAILFSLADFFTVGITDMTESLIFAGVLSFIIFSILFINRKTKDLAQLKQHKVLALDQPENNIIIRLNPFSIILCIFNILIGIILVGASAYILIAFPISFFYLDEIARLLVLLWALGFGALMIWYQVKVLLFHFKPEKIN